MFVAYNKTNIPWIFCLLSNLLTLGNIIFNNVKRSCSNYLGWIISDIKYFVIILCLICQIHQKNCIRLKINTYFFFKNTSSDSVAPNLLYVLPRQNWVGKLTFLLLDLKLKMYFCINKQMTIITIIMKTTSKKIIKIPWTCTIKCYFIATIHPIFCHYFLVVFYYVLNLQFLVQFFCV